MSEGGRICRCSLGSRRDWSSQPSRSPSQLARRRLRSWWLSGPNNRRKNIAQRIPSSGRILRAAGIISTAVRHMAVPEQAATPAAAKRNGLACARWRTEKGPEISRNVSAQCLAIGCSRGFYSADQPGCSLLLHQHGSRQSRDSAAPAETPRCYFDGISAKIASPDRCSQTERRTITGGGR